VNLFSTAQMLHRCNQLICVGLAPNFLHRLINQTYLGDVTIIAPLSIKCDTRTPNLT
jgi:hypothetical protein